MTVRVRLMLRRLNACSIVASIAISFLLYPVSVSMNIYIVQDRLISGLSTLLSSYS